MNENNVVFFGIMGLFWLYWLLCIALLKIFKGTIPVLDSHYLLGKKIFLFSVLLFMFSGFFRYLIKNANQLSSLIILSFLMIVFSISALIVFTWYCNKDRGLALVFPVLLLKYGSRNVETFIRKHWDC